MTQKNKAIIQMIVCSFLWSIAGIIIKLINCNPLVIAGFRSLFAAITVYIFMKVAKIKFVFSKKSVLSAVFLCLTFFAFVGANKLTTAANAIVLQFTSPVFILVISYFFFRKKIYKADVLAVVFTLVGIALFFLDEMDAGSLLGNIVAIMAGGFMASMFVFCGDCEDDERMTGIFLGHIFTAAMGILFTPFTQNTLDFKAVLLFMLLGVVQLGIPYILASLAMSHCSPLACSLISVIEPLLNPVWVLIFDGEIPGVSALYGAAIIIVTITVWCVCKEKYSQ